MWPFSRKADPEAAIAAAVKALQSQTPDIEAQCAQAERDLYELLDSSSALLLLFGFVDYFAQQNKITKRHERVNLAVTVFRRVFGDLQGNRMYDTLESALRAPDAQMWCREGFNAASEFEASGSKLVSAFFDGMLGTDC